jgi:hypothetical protein
MKFFCTKLFVIFYVLAHAQPNTHDDSLLVGTWKGTSICQVRPSPCNDEIAVYHIMGNHKQNSYHIVMNKVVNEREEDMGAGDYSFDPVRRTLSYWDGQHKIALNLHVTGNRMEGTLLYQDKIYRIIKLTKAEGN